MTNDTIGIDISKATLDVYRLSTNDAAQFPNTTAGLRALRCWISDRMPGRVVYEATGAYHAALERAFAGVFAAGEGEPVASPALRASARHAGQDRCGGRAHPCRDGRSARSGAGRSC